MEQQQPEGNWTLEDVKGALMDDMKAMMQNELRQALAGLMPPLAPVVVLVPNLPIVNAPPANNNIVGGNF